MECNNFLEQVELEQYPIYLVYSTSESGIAGRAEIAGIMSVDLDGLWTSIPEKEGLCSI